MKHTKTFEEYKNSKTINEGDGVERYISTVNDKAPDVINSEYRSKNDKDGWVLVFKKRFNKYPSEPNQSMYVSAKDGKQTLILSNAKFFNSLMDADNYARQQRIDSLADAFYIKKN